MNGYVNSQWYVLLGNNCLIIVVFANSLN